MRLIDAERLKADVFKASMDEHFMPMKLLDCDTVTEMIDTAPTIEERKTGKWEVNLMRHFAHLLICSNCGADINIAAKEHLEYYKRNFRYCPYCGVKMEVDE